MKRAEPGLRSIVSGKPVIHYSRGWWRVSPMPKPYCPERQRLWSRAHSFIHKLNLPRIEESHKRLE